MTKFTFGTLAISILLATTALADAGSSTHGILADLRNLAQKCVVRPYQMSAEGKKVLLPLRSTCEELVIRDKQNAIISIYGQNFYAQVMDSQDSDGGDLDNLVILNTHGRVVAIRRNVVSFDDVLIALAGGRDEFSQVRE